MIKVMPRWLRSSRCSTTVVFGVWVMLVISHGLSSSSSMSMPAISYSILRSSFLSSSSSPLVSQISVPLSSD